MRTFSYRKLMSNEVGRMYWASINFQAKSMEEAERICEKNSWDYDGEVLETIPAPELDKHCEEVQKQRDRDWLGEA